MMENIALQKNYISKMDFFIGARMHATIGALSSGVPVIPFSYSRKFEGLFNSIDYPFVIEATKWDTRKCLERTYQLIDNLTISTSIIKKCNEIALNRNFAYEEFVNQILYKKEKI